LVDGKPSTSIEGLPIKPVEVRREKPMRNRMAEFDTSVSVTAKNRH
jgi:hypothetical protein